MCLDSCIICGCNMFPWHVVCVVHHDVGNANSYLSCIVHITCLLLSDYLAPNGAPLTSDILLRPQHADRNVSSGLRFEI